MLSYWGLAFQHVKFGGHNLVPNHDLKILVDVVTFHLLVLIQSAQVIMVPGHLPNLGVQTLDLSSPVKSLLLEECGPPVVNC